MWPAPTPHNDLSINTGHICWGHSIVSGEDIPPISSSPPKLFPLKFHHIRAAVSSNGGGEELLVNWSPGTRHKFLYQLRSSAPDKVLLNRLQRLSPTICIPLPSIFLETRIHGYTLETFVQIWLETNLFLQVSSADGGKFPERAARACYQCRRQSISPPSIIRVFTVNCRVPPLVIAETWRWQADKLSGRNKSAADTWHVTRGTGAPLIAIIITRSLMTLNWDYWGLWQLSHVLQPS